MRQRRRYGVLLLLGLLFLSGCKEQESKEETTVGEETTAAESEDGSAAQGTPVAPEMTAKQKQKQAENLKNKEIIYIEEKVYLSQMTDIYMNSSDYLGRTISLEGYVLVDELAEGVTMAVVRDTPGCCGDDGLTGFGFTWDQEMPKENDWIRATGVLARREVEGSIYFVLEAQEIEVLEERGAQFVSQ